jgi:hypothetical protein
MKACQEELSQVQRELLLQLTEIYVGRMSEGGRSQDERGGTYVSRTLYLDG